MSRVSCSQSWVLKIFLHAAVVLSSEKIIIIFFKVMGKRKRGDANNPIDIVSSTPGKSFFLCALIYSSLNCLSFVWSLRKRGRKYGKF